MAPLHAGSAKARILAAMGASDVSLDALGMASAVFNSQLS